MAANGDAFNTSFYTRVNMEWFQRVLRWLPDPAKPLVFLPCGSAAKTRARYGKKMISKGLTHAYMSAITRDTALERVILSEPLTIIPYELEGLHPDYNLPPEALSIHSERTFINQLALWLARVKLTQPERQHAFYCGSTHHFFILHVANEQAGRPFQIYHEVPATGIRGYAAAARQLRCTIEELEAGHPLASPALPDIQRLLHGRAGYTHRAFWKEVVVVKQAKDTFTSQRERVTTRRDWETGFTPLYVDGD